MPGAFGSQPPGPPVTSGNYASSDSTMPGNYADDWDDDPNSPQARDLDESDSWDANDESDADMACPQCHGRVAEDANKCPHCGEWMTPVEPSGAFSRKWWIAVAVLLMLFAILRYVF